MGDFDGFYRLDWSHIPAVFRGKTRTCLVARTDRATFHIAKLDPKEMLATWAVSVDGEAVAGELQYYVFHNIGSAITHAEELNQKFQADAQKIVAK